MNDTKMRILELLKQPTTIKELQNNSGLKWANLSLHLRDLEEEGLIIEVGKEGKSRVMQLNQFNIQKYFKREEDKLQETKENLIEK